MKSIYKLAILSSVFTLPQSVLAAEINVIADGVMAGNLDTLFFSQTETKRADVIFGTTLGKSAGTLNVSEGLSAATVASGKGHINFLGNTLLIGDTGALGGIGEPDRSLEKITITFANADNVNLNGSIYLSNDLIYGKANQEIDLNANATLRKFDFNNKIASLLNIKSGKTITGAIDSSGGTSGNIVFKDSQSYTTPSIVTGTIGATNSLSDIFVGTGANKVVAQVQGNIKSNNTQIHNQAILQLGNNVEVTGLIDGTISNVGTLQTLGNSQINNAIGNINTLAKLDITGAGLVNLQGDTNAKTITINQDATLQVANNKLLNGTVDGSAVGQGTLKLALNATLNNSIGANQSLAKLDVAGPGLVDLQANASATQFSIASGGTLQVANNKVLTGAIDGANSGLGTLKLSQNATLNSTIGQLNPLSLISIAGAGTVNLSGDASANSITIAEGAYFKSRIINL